MAEKTIDNSAKGVLILIVPIAFAIVFLVTAWPVILALVLLAISWNIWRRYQWQKWSQEIDPIFHQLIQQNRGCLTPLDLSIKANLSGTKAKQYLDAKAYEFGVQVRDYDDKGTVYYFITANTLGSIFDDGIPSSLLESEERELVTSAIQESVPPLPPAEASPQQPEEELEKPIPEARSTEPLPKKHRILQSLIQSELARRLDVHSSTVMKRRDEPDFSEWSRSRDPEGIAWEYSSDTREFYPLENQ